MKKHEIDFRVYYEDTDAGGVVFHARYLHFAERARTELLRSLGYENQRLNDEIGLIFVVRNLDIHYQATSKLDDLLTVETTIPEIKNSSFIMHQKIHCNGKSVINMNIVLVCVATSDFKPIRMPEKIKDAFLTYTEDVK